MQESFDDSLVTMGIGLIEAVDWKIKLHIKQFVT